MREAPVLHATAVEPLVGLLAEGEGRFAALEEGGLGLADHGVLATEVGHADERALLGEVNAHVGRADAHLLVVAANGQFAHVATRVVGEDFSLG